MNDSDEYPTCTAPNCDRDVSDDASDVCDTLGHDLYSEQEGRGR